MQTDRINQFFTYVTQASEYCVGGSYLITAIDSAKTFIDAFYDPPNTVHSTLRPVETTRSRIESRMVSLVGFAGASARFLDWGNDKGWFVVTFIDAVVLKIIGHITGVIRYLRGCLDALDQLDELDRLSLIAHQWRLYEPGEFDIYRYSLWLNYFSYFAFAVGSALQFGSLMIGITALAATLNFLLTAGVICSIASLALYYLCSDPSMKLNHLRSLDQNSQYSYIVSSSVYSLL